jgi:Histidine phosphatase superfamily (branch 2)
MKLLHVQIVHRHGDRTPITPLLDEEFWQSQGVPDETLQRIGAGTRVVRDETAQPNNHGARGRGPFGQLTKLGLLQMVEVGTSIRDKYSSLDNDESSSHKMKLWTPARPIHPRHLKVYSTDFARTIQSVQGLLVGLLPETSTSENKDNDNNNNNDNNYNMVVEIVARHTNVMIPDPQPRTSDEQVGLERELVRAAAPKEAAMLPLARRVSASIKPLLSPNAHEISFGVNGDGSADTANGEEEPPEEIEVQPLSWNQLAEVCKCLSVYDRLPSGLDANDVAQVLNFSAQRWFDNLQNARLVHLATSDFVHRQLDVFCHHSPAADEERLMTIWSAHDSSIVGLLCAYRLERLTEWPQYASHLVLELLLDESTGERFVQFSMNGTPLQCRWEDDAEPRNRIPLTRLVENVERYTGLSDVATAALPTSASL